MVASNISATITAVDSTLTAALRGTGYMSATVLGASAFTTALLGYRQNLAATIGPAGPAGSVLDEFIEVGLTLKQALRLIAAATAGKTAFSGANIITYRNAVADSKNRIAATVTETGERTAITHDLTD